MAPCQAPRRMMAALALKLLLICSMATLMLSPVHAADGNPTPLQPNLVLLMTDDQGDMLGDTDPDIMPQLHELMQLRGQRFVNYFAPTPICCPSRVTIFRGQYAHNHNYTDVLGPSAGGVAGYGWFKRLGVDDSYLPTWLQDLGYNTYYTGKFLVDYNVHNYNDTPKGWTDIDALVGPYTFQYYNPVFSRNGHVPQQYSGQYSTDVVAEKAVAQMRTAAGAGKPFYLQVSPIAPHFSSGGPTSPDGSVPNDVSVPRYPPLPAPRHWHLFSDKKLPKPYASFNEEDVSDKPAWVRSLPRLSRSNVTYLEEVYRNRLRALRAVDELLGRLVAELDQLGILNNTYLLFTSDNGYHIGTHRRGSGKLSAYEEDIHVPLIIRGPGIKPDTINLQQASHADLAPTLLALAGAVVPQEIDGHPLPLIRDDNDGTAQLPDSYPDSADAPSRAQLPFTYYAGGNGDFEEYLDGRPTNANWTWKAIRVLDADAPEHTSGEAHRLFPRQRGYKYAVLCTNERELYDLQHDPNEANNISPHSWQPTGADGRDHLPQTNQQESPASSHWQPQAQQEQWQQLQQEQQDPQQQRQLQQEQQDQQQQRQLLQEHQDQQEQQQQQQQHHSQDMQPWPQYDAKGARGDSFARHSLQQQQQQDQQDDHPVQALLQSYVMDAHSVFFERHIQHRGFLLQHQGRSSVQQRILGQSDRGMMRPGRDGKRAAGRRRYIARLVKRLDVLLQVQQACWGASCRHPFQVIHNDTDTLVQDVWQALHPRYDAIYNKVPSFQFKSCQRYQDYDNEINYYRSILGTFPRGPNGVTLAPINITRYEHVVVQPAGRQTVLTWPQHEVHDDEQAALQRSDVHTGASRDELQTLLNSEMHTAGSLVKGQTSQASMVDTAGQMHSSAQQRQAESQGLRQQSLRVSGSIVKGQSNQATVDSAGQIHNSAQQTQVSGSSLSESQAAVSQGRGVSESQTQVSGSSVIRHAGQGGIAETQQRRLEGTKQPCSGHSCGTAVTVLADIERFAVPLSHSQLQLSKEQLYGPPGTSSLLT